MIAHDVRSFHPGQALLSRDAVVKIVYARLFGFVVSYSSPISL